MAIYIDNQHRIKDIFINVHGEKKKVTSIWCDKDGTPMKVFPHNNSSLGVTWADGTDEQIASMLDAHYAGEINIYDYWNIGDERIVHLSAMEKGVVTETHVEQDVTMVLIDKDVKYLKNAINNQNKCAFVVCQKEPLIESGIMNMSGMADGIQYEDYSGWGICRRRTWCNTTYRQAFPEKFRKLFKLHRNYFSDKNNISFSGYDYFALLSEKEFCGLSHASDSSAESYNKQFTYFKTPENQSTEWSDICGESTMWTRSTAKESSYPSNRFVLILPPVNSSDTDIYSKTYMTSKHCIRPFGCI